MQPNFDDSNPTIGYVSHLLDCFFPGESPAAGWYLFLRYFYFYDFPVSTKPLTRTEELGDSGSTHFKRFTAYGKTNAVLGQMQVEVDDLGYFANTLRQIVITYARTTGGSIHYQTIFKTRTMDIDLSTPKPKRLLYTVNIRRK